MGPVRILDLDGGIDGQEAALGASPADRLDARAWGPRVRLACSFRLFRRFEGWLRSAVPDPAPGVTFYGSGDFHHITLALLRRSLGPFNLLILDKHPDWMRGIPFLHCGTWLRHALRLPELNHVFHCGGELDFDNAYRRLAPWSEIFSGRVVVLPARRRFRAGRWTRVPTHPLRGEGPVRVETLERALAPHRAELRRLPLYVSVDKDVLTAEDAAVNWDSGLLRLEEVETVIRTFLAFAAGKLAGADVLGDWSPVVLGSALNRVCHRLDHPSPVHDAAAAAARNARANSAILRALGSGLG